MKLFLGLLISITLIGGVHAAQPSFAPTEPAAENSDVFWSGWTKPVNISQSSSTAPEANWPALAVDASGQLIYAAWSDRRGTASGTPQDIYYAVSVDGGWNWSGAYASWTSSQDSLRPTLTMSGTTPMVAWADEDPVTSHHTTYQAVLGSGSPVVVPNPNSESAAAPRLVWGYGGELHLALHGGTDGSNDRTDILYDHRGVEDTAWPGADVVFTKKVFRSEEPALAVSADGQTLHLVWQETYTPILARIFYMRGVRSGDNVIWDGYKQLSADDALSVRPAIVVGGGAVHVAWGEVVGNNQYIRYRSDDGDGTWDGSSHLIDDDPVQVNNILPTYTVPSLAVTPSGAVCAAWDGYRTNADYEAEEIYVSCSTNGGSTWWTPVNVSRSSANQSVRPVLDAGGDGILHLAWQEYVGPSALTNYQIHYAHSLPFTVMLPIVGR